ncbi:MAG TPA: Spy/CpxP family protein refolding chaperone [Candidatus Solibacter sp.]|nr:Spy/CpxP family protein refolding chaperone [Candidatus Solibacter sp.]
MKNAVQSSIIILALAASAAFAQMGPAPGDPAEHAKHHLAMLTKQLDLTPAQQQQATTIFTNAAGSQTTIHNNLKTAHDGLNAAIKTNDTAAIDQAATNIGNLTAQMISAHAKARAAFFQILTPDQQTKLTQFESQHEHFGPGGMRGFHGHSMDHPSTPQ